MRAPDATLNEGGVLAGKYRVEKVLGQGGMGVVVAAHHLELDQRVAIKFLLPEIIGNADAVARFLREARAAVKIRSEHVAKVTDVGKLEGGAPYMVMEYLDGSDLSAWLRQQGALPVQQAVDFVLQACEAMAEAHTLGIVHRDLKPSNLFVIRRPDATLSVKVLDFGISKTTATASSSNGHTATSLTSTLAVMGSPLYMSPEQMESSRDVDARSDIWSIGVILYELITGGPPFFAESIPALVLRVARGDGPPPLRERRPDVPAGLEPVAQRCLAKDRRARYENVGELAVALAPFGSAQAKVSAERILGILKAAGLSAPNPVLPAVSGAEPVKHAATATSAAWGQTMPPKKRGAWLFAAGALLVVGAGLALVSAVRGSFAQPTTPEASAPSAASATAAPPANASVQAPATTTAAAAPEPAAEPIVPPTPAAPSASALRRTASSVVPPPAKPAPRTPSPVAAPRVAATPNTPPRAAETAAAKPPPRPTSASGHSIFDDR